MDQTIDGVFFVFFLLLGGRGKALPTETMFHVINDDDVEKQTRGGRTAEDAQVVQIIEFSQPVSRNGLLVWSQEKAHLFPHLCVVPVSHGCLAPPPPPPFVSFRHLVFCS